MGGDGARMETRGYRYTPHSTPLTAPLSQYPSHSTPLTAPLSLHPSHYPSLTTPLTTPLLLPLSLPLSYYPSHYPSLTTPLTPLTVRLRGCVEGGDKGGSATPRPPHLGQGEQVNEILMIGWLWGTGPS
ncbi:hypothetical protein Pmani_001108 [Petrolisthes manimaculis]|uniref:Uncharacterized protein n=1 Tax=Petrolisthes manimaculis TaxID=1843537 RepID=A0AAE1QKD8_9EUCA|nr:hypothetical protein Pmani_001108 [Petrolisthes manimaculis]